MIRRHLPYSAFLLTLLLGLASCTQIVPRPAERVEPPPSRPEPTPPSTAREAGVRAGPAVDRLISSPAAAARALAAFRISCPDLVRRPDLSGLAEPAEWADACAAASRWPDGDALVFFSTHFAAARVGDGRSFATGYYEPEIRGSRERRPGFEVPIYAKPADLLDSDPTTGQSGRGRIDENGRFVLYHDRAAIEAGALADRGLEIAWAADPVDLFFLQIQGSGRLRLPDGSVMRIGYAGQNGREYVALGRLMRERGLLQSPITMQAVVAWLRAHPAEGRALMQENKSYIFFTELVGPGPLGALGRPVTPRVTVAADPRFVPLGAPVILTEMEDPRADGLWVAQDTGGAIKGANRFDTFWGAGEQAAAIAGGMSANGRAFILLPRTSLARLREHGPSPQQ